MLACFCLNITIEATPNDFQKVTPESLALSDEEKADRFFKQDIQKVGNLIGISKVHSCLVRKRNVGAWSVSHCMNCDCYTHAVHRQKGASMVIVSSKLLNSAAIASVKSSDIFSTIYNIVVNPNDIGLEDRKDSDTYKSLPPHDLDHHLTLIRSIMSDFITRESRAVEERIKKFTNEQYDQLNYWKDRAFKEHESLVRVICSGKGTEPESTKKPSYGFSVPAATSARLPNLTDTVKGLSVSSGDSSPATLHDKQFLSERTASSKGADSDELMFEFESDEMNSALSTDLEESDREDKEEGGIRIPKSGRGTRPSMAKSLPMNIPAFIPKGRHGVTDDSDDGSPVDEKVDIAASIKALAKSVHGDPVFGDLPRPRFSTQI